MLSEGPLLVGQHFPAAQIVRNKALNWFQVIVRFPYAEPFSFGSPVRPAPVPVSGGNAVAGGDFGLAPVANSPPDAIDDTTARAEDSGVTTTPALASGQTLTVVHGKTEP